jgi:hypothetical protein
VELFKQSRSFFALPRKLAFQGFVLAKERLLTLFEDFRNGLLAAVGGLVVMAVAVCVVVAAVRVAMTLGMFVALGTLWLMVTVAIVGAVAMCLVVHSVITVSIAVFMAMSDVLVASDMARMRSVVRGLAV